MSVVPHHLRSYDNRVSVDFKSIFLSHVRDCERSVWPYYSDALNGWNLQPTIGRTYLLLTALVFSTPFSLLLESKERWDKGGGVRHQSKCTLHD